MKSTSACQLSALPPLKIQSWKTKELKRQAGAWSSITSSVLLPGTSRTTWKGAGRHQPPVHQQRKESGREVNEGMLASRSKESIPKGKKKEENTYAERTGGLPHSFKKAKFLTESVGAIFKPSWKFKKCF